MIHYVQNNKIENVHFCGMVDDMKELRKKNVIFDSVFKERGIW